MGLKIKDRIGKRCRLKQCLGNKRALDVITAVGNIPVVCENKNGGVAAVAVMLVMAFTFIATFKMMTVVMGMYCIAGDIADQSYKVPCSVGRTGMHTDPHTCNQIEDK